ncbi:MAG: hypothetical protein IPM37_22435 [Hahellaceae bacterium]|nr:hypothetical protein [Hahellaceae bacterium]
MLDSILSWSAVSLWVWAGLIAVMFCLSFRARVRFALIFGLVNAAAWLWGGTGLLVSAVIGAAFMSAQGVQIFTAPSLIAETRCDDESSAQAGSQAGSKAAAVA